MTSDLGEAKSVDRSNNFCRPAHQLWASEPLSDATQRLSLAQTILVKRRASYISFTYRNKPGPSEAIEKLGTGVAPGPVADQGPTRDLPPTPHAAVASSVGVAVSAASDHVSQRTRRADTA